MSDKKIWLGVCVLVLLTLLAYLPAIRCGYIWDDDKYLTENPTLHTLDGLGRIWTRPASTPQYYPLVFTTFWIEHQLWGLHAAGYHLINVLLHACNAILLWRILRRLNVPAAWLAAALFALHPVHVESVAWITERKNVLSGFFYLVAFRAYLRFLQLDDFANGASAPRWRNYGLALGLYLCALLSKTVTCSLPVAILIVLWWKGGRITRGNLKPLLPMFGIGITMGLMTVWMELRHVGAVGEEWHLSLVERCLIAGRALWFYAAKLIWPLPLTFIYPRWRIDIAVWWQYAFPLAAVATGMVTYRSRNKIGRGPFAALLFFACTLAPALGFVNVYPMRFSFVADHFQYLASIGLIVLIAAICARVTAGWPLAGRWCTAAIVLFVLGSFTWRQCHIYENPERLWLDTIRKNPSALIAHYNLADQYVKQRRIEDAIPHYQDAIHLAPDFADGHNNLGLAFALMGRKSEAIQQYEEAIRIKPDLAEAHNNLGAELAEAERFVDALPHFEQAARLKPAFLDAQVNLGLVLVQLNRMSDAKIPLGKAIELAEKNGKQELARNLRAKLEKLNIPSDRTSSSGNPLTHRQ